MKNIFIRGGGREDFLGLYSIKTSQKTKKGGGAGGLKKWSKLQETKETWQLNAIHGPILKAEKTGLGSTDKTGI